MRRLEPRRWLLVGLAAGLAASISVAEIALVALAVAMLARRGRPVRLPLLFPIVAFTVWTAIAALASARPLESLVAAKTTLGLMAVWVVADAVADRSAVRRWMTLLFALVAAASVVAILQVALCQPGPIDVPVLARFLRKCQRARGFFSIYMTLAGVLTIVLVAVVPVLTGRRRSGAWPAPAWLAGVVALALTQVRGAWIGFAVGCVGAFALTRRRAVLLGGLSVVVLVIVLLPGVRARVVTLGRLEDDTSRDRVAMLRGAMSMVRDHPWIGVGPGQVKYLYPEYAPPEALRRSTSHVHNTPVQILVERGIVGLALWVTLFAVFFARAVQVFRALPAGGNDDRAVVAGVIAAVAAFLVAGLFEYNFGDTEVLLVACSLMALPFVVERSSEADAAAAT